ncbi:MAG TPA: epoxyqueuosine reductase [Chloroflexi bacterium]|nr:epoxyqueuosine reductase [Chloroflexota bacterium]
MTQAIASLINREVAGADTLTAYRQPLLGFARADDERFEYLRREVEAAHVLPVDLLPGARAVLSFFLPFERWIVEANAAYPETVAREWAVAYVETNALIGRITAGLIAMLAERGIRAAAEPATHNFDPESLVSRWSHKSVAVIAGLGAFGLHHMVITDAGCAGRFGSVVIDAALPELEPSPLESKVRCLYFHDGSCRVCVARCPVGALDSALDGDSHIDKRRCYRRLLAVAEEYRSLGLVDVCGKCAVGPCAFGPAV